MSGAEEKALFVLYEVQALLAIRDVLSACVSSRLPTTTVSSRNDESYDAVLAYNAVEDGIAGSCDENFD